MIVMRTPKGWTGPKEVDGKPVEGTWRAHQVPFATVHGNPGHLKLLEDWLSSYKPRSFSTSEGRFRAEFAEIAPKGRLRMGMNPHANGGVLLHPLELPDFADYEVKIKEPGGHRSRSHARTGLFPARRDEGQPEEQEFPRLRPR